jgi:hypothetical protein
MKSGIDKTIPLLVCEISPSLYWKKTRKTMLFILLTSLLQTPSTCK